MVFAAVKRSAVGIFAVSAIATCAAFGQYSQSAGAELATATVKLNQAQRGHTGQRDTSSYAGLGAWVDIYDPNSFNAPEKTISDMASHGVKTLYVETGNYRQKTDLFRPDRLARFIRAGHAADMDVVAWYLPSFGDLRKDLRRTMAAINFTTAGGDGFDSFALDIESPAVKPATIRSRRLIELSRQVRKRVGAEYPLGAIIPSPMGMERAGNYWPRFPYRELTRFYDVWVPMNYFTYRPFCDVWVPMNYFAHRSTTRRKRSAYKYTRDNVTKIRQQTGDAQVPIHVIGGVAYQRLDRGSMEGFVQGVNDSDVDGASLYNHRGMQRAHWQVLRRLDSDRLQPTAANKKHQDSLPASDDRKTYFSEWRTCAVPEPEMCTILVTSIKSRAIPYRM